MKVPRSDLPHWSEENFLALDRAENYSHLADIALDVLKRTPKPICEVCGPISSGGVGSVQGNLEVFQDVITKLQLEGDVVFSQVPFERSMQMIRDQSSLPKEESNLELLENFYGTIFESGFISRLFFIHGWESSHGATWERKKALELGIEVVDLPEDFLE